MDEQAQAPWRCFCGGVAPPAKVSIVALREHQRTHRADGQQEGERPVFTVLAAKVTPEKGISVNEHEVRLLPFKEGKQSLCNSSIVDIDVEVSQDVISILERSI